jgi:hypothetical protein
MKVKIYLSVILCAVLALATIGFSQTPRIVRWETSDANSKRVFHKGAAAKQLSVDGIDGVTVTASIMDRPDSFSVELEVRNHGKKNLDVRPEDIQLQMIRPWSRNLSFISVETIARRIMESENLRASRVPARWLKASAGASNYAVLRGQIHPGKAAQTQALPQPIFITTSRDAAQLAQQTAQVAVGGNAQIATAAKRFKSSSRSATAVLARNARNIRRQPPNADC